MNLDAVQSRIDVGEPPKSVPIVTSLSEVEARFGVVLVAREALAGRVGLGETLGGSPAAETVDLVAEGKIIVTGDDLARAIRDDAGAAQRVGGQIVGLRIRVSRNAQGVLGRQFAHRVVDEDRYSVPKTFFIRLPLPS